MRAHARLKVRARVESRVRVPGFTGGLHTHDLFLDPQLHATDQNRSAVLAALADALRQVCRRLYWLCGNPDFNIIVRAVPLKHDKQLAASYHWHLEVSPRFTKAGGLELATQNSFSVLLTDPADAARKLRAPSCQRAASDAGAASRM